MRGLAEDPAPDHDLPSDIVLRMFLATLDYDTVKRDLEPRSWREGRYLHAIRDERDHPIR